MLHGIKFRLYPNKEQAVLLDKHIGACRWVYNWSLATRLKVYAETKKSMSYIGSNKLLTQVKKQPELAWLNELSAHALQNAAIPLDTAFKRFYAGVSAFPKFHKKGRNDAFYTMCACLREGKLKVQKVPGLIKIRGLRKFTGKVSSFAISKTATGKYFCAVRVDTGAELPAKSEVTEQGTIGLDLGLTHFAILSTGEKIENPRKLKWSLKKLAKLQRRHSRKQKGSKNRNKARIKVARCHEKVANQRRDFLHKLSTRLIRENQAVAIEDLAVKNMVRNHCLARSVSDASWSEFVRQLKYKAEWHGKTVLQIGRFEPSSKLCTCGVINRSLKLSDRTWTCSSCGTTHDRDILAANNIKRMGLLQAK
jgi:putative transposase